MQRQSDFVATLGRELTAHTLRKGVAMDRSDCLSSAEDPNLGRTLRERYRIDERIGSGSMGAVYRAWDLLREQACAVKLLRLQVATRESIVIRFCDEARIVARLCHPSIVELYDQGEDPDGTLFLVMELLRGQDLYAYLRIKPRLPLCRTLEIVRQIGSALHTVHLSGVVHRDIKPRKESVRGTGFGYRSAGKRSACKSTALLRSGPLRDTPYRAASS